MAANFGRDADTIATMVGGLAGAFGGRRGLRVDWLWKAEAGAGAAYPQLVEQLVQLVRLRPASARAYSALIDQLLLT